MARSSIGLIFSVVALTIFIAGCSQPTTTTESLENTSENVHASQFEEVVVVKVVDWDTIVVQFTDRTHSTVRFIGVAAPEDGPHQTSFGGKTKTFVRDELRGRTVFLERDVEESGEGDVLSAYVWTEVPEDVTDETVRAHLFNAKLLLGGYVSLQVVPLNVAYREYFKEYESEARQQSNGIWGPAPAASEKPKPAPPPEPKPAPAPAPEETVSMSVAERKAIFWELAEAEDRAMAEADAVYDPMNPDYDNIMANIDLNDELYDRYYKEILKRYGISDAVARKIMVEGSQARWPTP